MKSFGIDIGTTSICVAGYEEGCPELQFVASGENAFLPGTFEQDPERILNVVEHLMAEAAEHGFGPEQLDGIGISSQMHGILYVDRNGKAVSPFYTWKDERGRALREDGCSWEEYLQEKTGCPLYSGYGSVTHFCLGCAGGIPADAVWLAGIGDYLAMHLTGRKVPLLDESMAASFGGFDLKKGCFDLEKLEQAGVDISFYPPLRKGGEPAGFWKGVPVDCAVGDNQASFYGALDRPETQVSVNVGTGSQVSVFDARLVAGAPVDIRPFFQKGFLYVGASLNGGKVYERLAAFFEETVQIFTGQKINAYDIMGKISAKETGGLTVRPLLYGARGAKEQSGGTAAGLTAENFHPDTLIQAYVNGMAEELYEMYCTFPEEIRAGRTEIVASGNGIRKNRLLQEAVASRFGLPVTFRDTREEAATGAAKAALKHAGAGKRG